MVCVFQTLLIAVYYHIPSWLCAFLCSFLALRVIVSCVFTGGSVMSCCETAAVGSVFPSIAQIITSPTRPSRDVITAKDGSATQASRAAENFQEDNVAKLRAGSTLTPVSLLSCGCEPGGDQGKDHPQDHERENPTTQVQGAAAPGRSGRRDGANRAGENEKQ